MEEPKDQVLFAKGLRHEEAIVLVGALEAGGVDAFLKTENLGGHVPGGVNNYVFVAEKDLERARQIQAEVSAEPGAAVARAPAPGKAWPRRALWAGAWLLSLMIVGGVCFQAGRTSLTRPKQNKLQVSPFDGRSFYEEDEDGDGRPDAQHFVDKGGRHLESRFDRNEDGSPDLVRFYHFDGHVTREEQDTDYNGQLDRWEDLTEGGGTRHAKYDLDGDGQVDMESFYDEDERLAKTVTTREGKVADETHYENDLATRSLVDLDRDGRLDTEVLFDDLGVYRETRKLKR